MTDGTIEEFEDRAIGCQSLEERLCISARTPVHYRWISLDAFVKANMLKLGLSVACPSCLKKNWVGLAAMREQIECERCLKPFAFPQGTLDFKHTPWRYRVVGPFSVPDFAGGAYATVLALGLSRTWLCIGDADLTYATGLDFAGVGSKAFRGRFHMLVSSRAMFGAVAAKNQF